jgi:hypothetical protein
MQSGLGLTMTLWQTLWNSIRSHSQTKIGVCVTAKAVYTEATFKRIIEDALFFRREAGGVDTERERKRHARAIILLMALYLESLSNRIFLHFFDPATPNEKKELNRCLDNVDSRSDLPGPVRNFRAVYQKCLNKELTLDINGIKDIFTIRNRIIAHPSGRAQLETEKEGWKPLITNVKWRDREVQIIPSQLNYAKFKQFPSVYSHFTLGEADAILTEVKDFLTSFLDLIKENIPKKQFNEWWPAELVEWSKTVSSC